MRILLSLIALTFSGCGAAPPPKPPPPKPKLKTLVPVATPSPTSLPVVRYVILSNKGTPEVSDVENRIGKKGGVADVGETGTGIEIALAGVVCEFDPMDRPSDVPKSILPADLLAQGLSDEEGKALDAASKSFQLVCKGEEGLPARNLPPEAEMAASALAELMDGWIGDLSSGRYWPRADWRASRKANKRYENTRSIRVVSERFDDGFYWIGTRGMKAFGRPDVELFPVSDARAEAMATQLRVLADLLIDEVDVGPGTVLSLGPVDALLMGRAVYAETLPSGTSGRDRETPGPSTARLAIVDPNAAIGDLGQHQAFIRRLAVR